MTFSSRNEFARKHRVTRQTVARWVRAGFVELAPDGKRVDIEASEARLRTRPRQRNGGRAAGPAFDDEEGAIEPHVTIAEAQRRKLLAQAAREEFELGKARGNFLAREEVVEQVAPLVLGVRQFVLRIPGAFAFECPSLTPVDKAALERVCRDSLEDAALHRAYCSVVTAEDARNFEAEFNQIRPHLLELPLQLADRLVGLSREQIRQVLHEAICDALEKLSAKPEKLP